MIGQKRLLDELDSLKTLPRTMIISGSRGGGKKLIAKKIAEKLDAEMIMCDGKVDTVREVTELAYKLVDNIMYVFPNVENMSTAAKNALLKITEEPPNKSYFVLTTTDLSQVLDTIKSRAVIFFIDTYSQLEIEEYIDLKYSVNEIDKEYISAVCSVPGQVDLLMQYNISEFADFINLVINNIFEVNIANAFKISNRLQLKQDDDGYDLVLFFRALQHEVVADLKAVAMNVSKNYTKDEVRAKVRFVEATTEAIIELSYISFNKQSIFDSWLLKIREIHDKYRAEE